MRSFLFFVFWRCPYSRGFAPLTEGGMCDSIPKRWKNSPKITCSILWPSETKRARKRANDPSDTRTLQIAGNIQRKIFISTPAFLVGYSIILRWLSSVSGGYVRLSGTSGATTLRPRNGNPLPLIADTSNPQSPSLSRTTPFSQCLTLTLRPPRPRPPTSN